MPTPSLTFIKDPAQTTVEQSVFICTDPAAADPLRVSNDNPMSNHGQLEVRAKSDEGSKT